MDRKVIHTRKRYMALAAAFILLGLGLVFLPDKENKKEMDPEHMLAKLIDKSRYLSTDEVADRLVNNDPSLILVDIRAREEFDKGSLPGALNIPMEDILGEESIKIFQRKAYDKVIFGNSDIYADQAWILLSRQLMERTYIMQGGLNKWISTIIDPQEPQPGEPIEKHEQYHFRNAASRYFSGQSKAFEYQEFTGRRSAGQTGEATAKPKVILPAPKVTEAADEGC